ncbi:MAG: tRNA (adenosine(37)-N6)-threonylcarbamoyltransferase complex dimerization subunit type 1 TsaB [Armatimonadota bacterium]|nr:tRNA (adenosine(37)-N6)-threonylcarbamoyltransferase complex dimerization subunit type 1 TsaB [Armatimonadota bacterium]MDW8155281.1 tRNA (adenosine(37)-N6)-threonylcarbamoyltransferase complex dimerization subunit type 1 TsaB [Armatimonadota bacterium]
MRVLGVETATDTAAVALVDGAGVLGERVVRRPMYTLEWVAAAIHGLLEDLSLGPDVVEGVAVSVGPGSFTGLRVGIATAVGWARARGLPACGVPTLEAIAAGVEAAVVGVVVDAKRGEVAGALFERKDGRLVRVVEEQVAPPEDVASAFREAGQRVGRCVLVGDGLGRWVDVFARALPEARFAEAASWAPRAAQVAWLGRKRLLEGGAEPLVRIQPWYGRTPAFRSVAR